MASVKLTNERREKLIKLVTAEAYQEEREVLQDRWDDYARRVYYHFYGQYAELMAKLPPDAFERSGTLYIRGHKSEDQIDHNAKTLTLSLVPISEVAEGRSTEYYNRKKYMPVFYSSSNHQTLPYGHPLWEEWEELRNEQGNIQLKIKDVESELRRVLNSVNTKKQLLEAWPAGAEWIEKAIPDPANLPAVIDTHKLNDILCEAIGPRSKTCEGDTDAQGSSV